MLGQGNEGDRGEEHENAGNIAPARDLVGRFRISAEHSQEGKPRHLDQRHIVKGGQIDQLQGFNAGAAADQGHHQGDQVRAQNTDDEGNHLHALAALGAGIHRNQESDHAHQNGPQVIGTGGGIVQVVDRASAQGKADQGDGGADDHGGQQFIDPFRAGRLDDQSDHHIDQSGEHSAQENAQEAERHSAGQRADERKGAAQENGALPPGRDEKIEQRTKAGAAEGGRLAHVNAGAVHQNGHQQGRGHDGQELLESIDQVLFQRRFFIDVVHQFHKHENLLFLSRKSQGSKKTCRTKSIDVRQEFLHSGNACV